MRTGHCSVVSFGSPLFPFLCSGWNLVAASRQVKGEKMYKGERMVGQAAALLSVTVEQARY